MSNVVIVGLGEYAQVAAAYLADDSDHTVAAFTAHRQYIREDSLLGKPVVPFEEITQTHPPSEFEMLVAVGYKRVNRNRKEMFRQVKDLGYTCITYINSRARIFGQQNIGENTFIFEDNVVQPFAKVGDNCILWSGNHICHHAVIEDNCFIASHVVVSGGTTIGDSTFIGANATFRDHINVAASNVIGAGSLIMRDTAEGDVFKTKSAEAFDIKSWELEGCF